MTFAEENLELELTLDRHHDSRFKDPLEEQLRRFCDFGKATRILETKARTFDGRDLIVPTYVNEFWTARQRAAQSLHEISYRACFKPQLPRFFIERLSASGDIVYDPFMGRGTTPVEAALLGRIPYGCDINPLSQHMVQPRLKPPTPGEIAERLRGIKLDEPGEMPEELLTFYHPETLKQLCSLRKYLLNHRKTGGVDDLDAWIGMVALNRLTGHSPGFFSVYTMPPNQAVSVKAQRKINETRGQTPPKRDVVEIILRKSRQLLSDCSPAVRKAVTHTSREAVLLTKPASATPEISGETVSLVVTSPPFLNVVDYAADNWLRCWFIGVDPASVNITVPRKLEAWQHAMTEVFRELFRVLRRGGHVAFEVGEVRGGKIKLEEAVLPCGVEAGLNPVLVLINDQRFTKTANCWGVENNFKGTNTNRIVVFNKAAI